MLGIGRSREANITGNQCRAAGTGWMRIGWVVWATRHKSHHSVSMTTGMKASRRPYQRSVTISVANSGTNKHGTYVISSMTFLNTVGILTERHTLLLNGVSILFVSHRRKHLLYPLRRHHPYLMSNRHCQWMISHYIRVGLATA